MKMVRVFLIFILLFLVFFLVYSNKDQEYDNAKEGNFLIVKGDYSKTSATWGIGIEIDPNAELPKQYVIEWIIDDGTVRSWDKSSLQPKLLETNQKGNPFTVSGDVNNGAVIWSPDNFTNSEDVTISAYIYENKDFTKPIAYSKIILEYASGTYRLKD